MSASQNQLELVFKQAILNGIATERQTNSVLAKLHKAAITPELTKALSQEATNFANHISRLKLISSAIPLKGLKVTAAPLFVSIPKPDKKALQEVWMIAQAIALVSFKIAQYEFLQSLAIVLPSPVFEELLAQCITENRDTKTWLRQILQNIIAPTILSS
jgi:ferritin-like metal-binding protein YciE